MAKALTSVAYFVIHSMAPSNHSTWQLPSLARCFLSHSEHVLKFYVSVIMASACLHKMWHFDIIMSFSTWGGFSSTNQHLFIYYN